MKRGQITCLVLLSITLICILVAIALVVFPNIFNTPGLPPITPIAYPQESPPTPVPIPTDDPGVRVIPLPARIVTVVIRREFLPSDNPATVKIENVEESTITAYFDGVQVIVPPGGTETRKVPPGEYTLIISGACGEDSDTVIFEANTIYTFQLFCSPAGPSGEVFGPDTATLVVRNMTNVVITFSVSGRSYQVSPGSTKEITLPPGSYTWKASHANDIPYSETITLSAGESVPIPIIFQ